MAEITRKRQGEMVQAILRILRDEGTSLHVNEVLRRLEAALPPTDFEKTTYEKLPTVRRYEKIARFATISPVKAGWIRKGQGKDRGTWTLLDGGLAALESHTDPVALMIAAGKGYRAWKAAQNDDDDLQGDVAAPAEPTPIRLAATGGSPSAPSFKKVDYVLSHLLDEIDTGKLQVPDLQRPFLWKDVQVRQLLDSMYSGYPVGNLLLWEYSTAPSKAIGSTDSKTHDSDYLIIDGQQRLTSLYAVLRGKPVLRDDKKWGYIQIAFCPASREFQVANAVIRASSEWIPNISDVLKKSRWAFIKEFIELQRANNPLTQAEEDALGQALEQLFDLTKYPFTALQLKGDVAMKDAAEIFVRINSGGSKLKAADFILTLLSVSWPEGRDQIEDFVRSAALPSKSGASPYTPLFEPGADHLVRASIALGFHRADLSEVYNYLRGRLATTTGATSPGEDLSRLSSALDRVLNLTNWHDFFNVIIAAGFRVRRQIPAPIALVNAYSMFLIGREEHKIPMDVLGPLMARWFFMSSLTSRYTAGGEAKMEQDMRRIEQTNFVSALEAMISETLNDEYWSTALPGDVLGASKQSPEHAAYHAALVKLEAPVLYSEQKVAHLYDPAIKTKKASVEDHHLFPRGFLEKLGVSRAQQNKMANFAPLEYGPNSSISAQAPYDYAPPLEDWFNGPAGERRRFLHGLSKGWENQEYEEFLGERAKSIAKVIKAGFEAIGSASAVPITKEPPTTPSDGSLEALVASGEHARLEFKESLLWSMYQTDGELNPLTGKPIVTRTPEDGALSEFEVARTIAAFLNTEGGTLLIGVSDTGEIKGLQRDLKALPKKQDADGFVVQLTNSLAARLGQAATTSIEARCETVEGKVVCVVTARRGDSETFLGRGDGTPGSRFFVRSSATTRELKGEELMKYTKTRWPGI